MSLFLTLASLYRKSALRKRDFTIDYEKFLRLAEAADGDARELAEKELQLAESESHGIFKIDRNNKSLLPERLRIALEGGEAWLFSKTGIASPSTEREELAIFFEQSAKISVPKKWQPDWQDWCHTLATNARSGSSTQPFTPANLTTLMQAISGVLNWQGESLIRYASARICGNSKQLGKLEPRIINALAAIAGETSLEAFGIFQKPRTVTFHGPLTLGGRRRPHRFLKPPGSRHSLGRKSRLPFHYRNNLSHHRK